MPHYRILIALSDRKLYLQQDHQTIQTYPVGIGKELTHTPVGDYTIINRQAHPGGPFGAYWLGLSRPHYGIHGTNDPSSIGGAVSHGCVRMHNEDVLALAKFADIGTPVSIRY
jgi:lipoprotein-anchoring transpeptidase ErfK/SrfK